MTSPSADPGPPNGAPGGLADGVDRRDDPLVGDVLVGDVADAGRRDEALAAGDLRQRRITAAYAIAFLVFLAFPAVELWSEGGWRAAVGLPLLALFVLAYAGGYLGRLLGMRAFRWLTRAGPWPWLIGLTALAAGLTAILGLPGLTCLTYVAAGAGATLPTRQSLSAIAACGMAMFIGTLAYTGSWLWASGLAFWTAGIGAIVWGSVAMSRHSDALTRAREEKAELAVELERTRLARDLHDILGHSLTVITVKAELAGRLIDTDPAQAKAEIIDLERLARDALADVRTTVSGYRQLSLPTELIRARKALQSAGITARVPGAADLVDTRLRDLFAWVVREGVTNVVRHSGASTCEITLGADEVVVRDDGTGPGGEMEPGNGLTGLRERARQVGAQATAGRAADGGFELCVRATEPAPPRPTAPSSLATKTQESAR
ncbi:two-component system sensor histidine kinase DesK [Kineosphaera limosa]|nr:sensor histidine kinase [Kineosphaera limosa]NYE00568.1 two-component system sensor histidine kinase DesK [Kineosphaera limosa]